MGRANPHAAWVEIFSRRLSLWQQQLLQPPYLLAVPPAVLAGCAHQVAVDRTQSFPFSVGSTASQVGATAWFVSAVLWIQLCVFLQRSELAPAPGHRSPRSARTSRLARHISSSCCSHSCDASVCVQGTCSVLSLVCFIYIFDK